MRAQEEGRLDRATRRACKRVARRLFRKLQQMNLLDEDIEESDGKSEPGTPVKGGAGGRSAARAAILAHREKQAAFDTIFGDPSNGP